MPCPIYVWAPLAAAAVPVARALRHHFTGMDFGPTGRDKKRDRKGTRPEREMKRWAPVGAPDASSSDPESGSR